MSGVLLICHANTCRSVMAQALLEHMLAERGVDGRIRVRSAGVSPYARDGMLASLDARIVLREVGIHLTEDVDHLDRSARATATCWPSRTWW